ncbi:acetoin utilization protein AcuC [Streptosporangium sp. NBC_01756]|uniref:acetoin utilization protein AcuC n=1 Tax=Streptosporangium sp. NBC_01756 TaxID=2975950 RepID=UPI002DD92D62|nr:acetoin utilization protein AcuC [Streptosporangium sp. NBC_01756]WSC83022.1 acetoin utilization protein AcuC [Streptosporangium sp. NBC_01756]
MSRSVRVVWDDALTSYDFGPGHPLAPVRVALTMALARELGVLDAVEVVGCAPASDDELALVHNRDYIEAVKRVSASGRPDLAHGLGTEDNPAFVGVHEASALITGASIAAARAVWTGEAEHAVNVAGGLHHAMAAAASGFCVYNDPAAAIGWLLSQGASRVAYVDVDVHHGDGVQALFYDDPRVLTISLHESPRTLFPGTGFPGELGAEGTAVNVALPAGCGDSGWLRAFHAVVPPLLREFAPEILVTQHGCDSHALDPLAHLMLSLDGQRAAYAALHGLAHETAGGRWVVTGGGGYELVQVVPRAWTHLIAEVSGHPLDPATATPPEWRRLVRERTGQTPPLTLTDGRDPEFSDFSAGYDPADPIDRAIMATRKAAFPLHGLDPLP